MKTFKPALRDGSDPLYAPCISWSKNTASWKAPKRFLEAGYQVKSVNLKLSGNKDDDLQIHRAQRCRELTIAMIDWWDAQDNSGWDVRTWGYVIHRYLTDDVSPYASVKANTQKGYQYTCAYWNKAIGHMKVEKLDFFELKNIEKTMGNKGRSVDFIHRMFTQLRGLARYAALLKIEGAADVKETLSNMRIKAPSPSDERPTRKQIEDVVALADAADDKAFAAGLLLQFEFALRGSDVRGQWFEISVAEYLQGGIVRKSRRASKTIYSRWQDGLCIEHFDQGMTMFKKVISKTAKSSPKPITFPLDGLPDLRIRLLELKAGRDSGPLIISSRHNLPFEHTAFTAIWRKYAKAAGVPPEIKLKDARAGGLTEAEQMGADPRQLQAAGQHANFSTTQRYLRDNDSQVAQVVRLRQTGRGLA
ncbi:tyrosine-type recombinase/integrase [Pacificibacter marinus]|uniref:Phage integrase family protein n=1 Tax=Pacificibacter marinus TaxID=658057 RepID=A0A1Y5SPT4_9RHOB|nr:tyrosine-type recombinase/integrase [Pacificibacter marinus]SEK72354.1 Phage integrase family protein [Pacificibacter marinus]SLN43860.1 Phage integrase family protein [Pacificibacter marinus]